MTKKDCSMEEIMERLQAPFSSKDIEWRISRCGISNGKPWATALAYVTSRAIQNRLDDVFTPAGWKNDFREFMNGILCSITCYVDGEWVTKSDGAEPTQFESLKGGFSSAMKRCGTQWGIGRYLYNLDEAFVDVMDKRANGAIYLNDEKKGVKGYWLPPKLPDWALPEDERGKNSNKNSQSNPSSSNQSKASNQGTTNKNSRSSQNQRENQKSTSNQNKGQGQGFNREGALNSIGGFLKTTGLDQHKGWIMPLFKRINPKIKQTTLNEVYQQATEEELKMYYTVLRPVNDLVNLANFLKVSMDDVLNYVQILCPEAKIESLFSCFMHLTLDKCKEINEMIREDLNAGHIKKTA